MLAETVVREYTKGFPQISAGRGRETGRTDMSYGLRRYQQTRTEMASREDILLMLYEGAIRFLEQSIQELDDKSSWDYLARHKILLGKGRAIIEEFQNTLDFEAGGELANQLNDLYVFMLDSLTQANLNQDIALVRRVIELLHILLEGWRGAVGQAKNVT